MHPPTRSHLQHDVTGSGSEPVTLREVLSAFDSEVATLVYSPFGDDVEIASAALVDSGDLSDDHESKSSVSDLYLLVGVAAADAAHWLNTCSGRPDHARPKAVIAKAALESTVLRSAARRCGIALISVDPKARWDEVYHVIDRVLQRSPSETDEVEQALATPADLFELAQNLALTVGGIVSIEDSQSHVLAYSRTGDVADAIRRASILEREGPRDYLVKLREWGVFTRLQRGDKVIELPGDESLGIKPRLVAGIKESSPADTLLGTIWIQQGNTPFAANAAEILQGSAAIAARMIVRTLSARSPEDQLVQQLFTESGGGFSASALAAALNLPTAGPAAVIGFAPAGSAAERSLQTPRLDSILRLHASSFRHDAVTTTIDDRIYVLLPGYQSERSVSGWTRQLVDQLEAQQSLVLTAAIAMPVAGIAAAAPARAEVDRVLNATALSLPLRRVTTLAESRSVVLLGEILQLLAERPELRDPRLEALRAHDAKHASALYESAEAYLVAHGDVRSAAATLGVHPNTLRYRLRRLAEIVGIDLTNPVDRLLLELQLALSRHTGVVEGDN